MDEPGRSKRLLIVLPTWIGDAVMATPALRRVRDALPGWYIGGVCRPGADQVLAGLDTLDEIHVAPMTGVLGPKRVAAQLRPRRYAAALLLTNSFSTALATRVAGIPVRLGFDRDGRGLLLTHRLQAPKRDGGGWAVIPAAAYYDHAAKAILDVLADRPVHAAGAIDPLPAHARLELVAQDHDRETAANVLDRAGIDADARLAVLNPGGNNPAKRWPAERYGVLADWLLDRHGLYSVVNASPAEADIASAVDRAARCKVPCMAEHGGSLSSLKGVLARSELMVTNDTGPRHIAAALGVPVVSLFGPTDHRWTTIPAPAGEAVLVADPSLPEGQTANDEPASTRREHARLRFHRTPGRRGDGRHHGQPHAL
ncbi:MAG: glycosyltransferase family 9 protein [Phycisphaerales bacterium]|nr:glycosyltransferase family 9 protein [Phycisphaerales bacterium]